MSRIEVEPDAVVASAPTFGQLAAEIRGVGTGIQGAGSLAQPPVAESLARVSAAWGRACDLLGEDVGLLEPKVRDAGVTYAGLESDIADVFGRSQGGVNR